MAKKHKKMKEGSMAGEAMESPQEEAAEGGMKRGGKAKKFKRGGKVHKVEGEKAKSRLDKPAKKASGGPVSAPMKLDSTDAGVSSTSPFAQNAPGHKKGGKVC